MSNAIEPVRVALGAAELIELHGPDAVAFAHAQFTSDVAGLGIGRWQFSAWLNAQGRTRGVFVLIRAEADRLLAWLPLGGAPAIRDALARFVLRAKVRVEVHADRSFASIAGGALDLGANEVRPFEGGFAFAQPGPRARVAWLGPAIASPAPSDALNAWRLDDVTARLPWLDPAVQDEFVPQALDLPRIDAIRFDKGCYPGQEIAARLHFRGGLKRGLHRLHLSGDAPATPGLRILSGETEAGVVLYGARDGDGSHAALCVLSEALADAIPLTSAHGHVARRIA